MLLSNAARPIPTTEWLKTTHECDLAIRLQVSSLVQGLGGYNQGANLGHRSQLKGLEERLPSSLLILVKRSSDGCRMEAQVSLSGVAKGSSLPQRPPTPLTTWSLSLIQRWSSEHFLCLRSPTSSGAPAGENSQDAVGPTGWCPFCQGGMWDAQPDPRSERTITYAAWGDTMREILGFGFRSR